MVYKIYKSNNYIIIIDENDNYFEEHCANVLVTKLLTADTTYDITFFRPENIPQAFYNVKFADIRQQSGAPYASVSAWETWYTTNTGLCSNNVVLQSILATLQAQTEVEGVFVKDLGNSDKIVLQVKVWDQDSQQYIATYYYNADGTLYTPVGPLEWVGTAGSVNATIISPLGDTTTCGNAVAITYCAGQATEFFDQGDTLDSILTELQSTLDINITNASLPVTQSGTWSVAVTSLPAITGTVALDTATLAALETITVNQGTSPWIISGTVALDTATLAALETINVIQSGTWTVAVSSIPAITGTVALDAATLAALETITVTQGTSPWVVSGTVNSVQSGTWNVNVANFPATQNVAVTSIVEVEVKNDTGNPLPVSGTVNVGNFPASVEVSNDVGNPLPIRVLHEGGTVAVPYASAEMAVGSGTTPVTISAGAISVSIQNLGNDNILVTTDSTVNVPLPPGVSVTFDAPVGQRFDAFSFVGTSVSSSFIVTLTL